MKSELISVIVPVYKVEPYLQKCVDSILNQTHRNLEIILVDDGSPDNCGKICDDYAVKDSRVKVIHKPNGGLSDARNAGMDIMTGQYVGFVDSDDWIEPFMYERLLELIHQFDADIAFGGVSDDLELDGRISTTKVSSYGETPFSESPIEAMRRYFHGSWSAWDKLYKADIFSGLRYPVGEINEDEAIVLQVLSRVGTVCYTNEVFYHYMRRLNGQSITTTSFSAKKLIWQKHCADNLTFVQKNHPELELEAAGRYRDSILWSLTEMALSNSDFTEQIQALVDVLRHNKNLFYKATFSYPQDKIRLFCLLYFPFNFYRTLIRIKRRIK